MRLGEYSLFSRAVFNRRCLKAHRSCRRLPKLISLPVGKQGCSGPCRANHTAGIFRLHENHAGGVRQKRGGEQQVACCIGRVFEMETPPDPSVLRNERRHVVIIHRL